MRVCGETALLGIANSVILPVSVAIIAHWALQSISYAAGLINPGGLNRGRNWRQY